MLVKLDQRVVWTVAVAALRGTRQHRASFTPHSPCFLLSLQLHGLVRRWRVKIICRGCDQPGVLPFPSFPVVSACARSWKQALVCLSHSKPLTEGRYPKQEGLEHMCCVCFSITTKFSSLNPHVELLGHVLQQLHSCSLFDLFRV